MKGRFEAGPYVNAAFDHRSFIHRLDHDLLRNLNWRELTGEPGTQNLVEGHKMLTHSDADLGRQYGIRYVATKEKVDVALPFLPGAKLSADYRNQMRSGSRQTLGVDHCASCHVGSQSKRVDDETRDLNLRLAGQYSRLKVSYRFSARDYRNHAATPTYPYIVARHPATGGAVEEFESRMIFDGADGPLEIDKTPDVKKRGHTVRATVDLPKGQTVRGTASYSRTTNQNTDLQLTGNTESLAWFAPLARKVRATASITRRSLQNDPYFVDIPAWREGRPGGGQDFDFDRLSAYDRTEYVGTASVTYLAMPGQRVRLDHRVQVTDRDHVVLDPDDPSATQTVRNRIRASWNGRLCRGFRSRASVEYEITHLPFVSVNGLCEKAISEADSLPGQPNHWFYYFQRSRYGTGATLPTKALRAKAHLSHRLGTKASATVYLNFASEKNDDLNLYEFDRTVVNTGLSAYVIPSQRLVVSGGVSYSKIESNADFCVPVMDG